MALDEIIFALGIIILVIFIIGIIIAFLSTRSRKRNQIDRFNKQENFYRPDYSQNRVYTDPEKYVFYVGRDDNQLELPFENEARYNYINREKIIRQYFENRERYEIINSPEIRSYNKASNYY